MVLLVVETHRAIMMVDMVVAMVVAVAMMIEMPTIMATVATIAAMAAGAARVPSLSSAVAMAIISGRGGASRTTAMITMMAGVRAAVGAGSWVPCRGSFRELCSCLHACMPALSSDGVLSCLVFSCLVLSWDGMGWDE